MSCLALTVLGQRIITIGIHDMAAYATHSAPRSSGKGKKKGKAKRPSIKKMKMSSHRAAGRLAALEVGGK